jgi:hypothetical protein
VVEKPPRIAGTILMLRVWFATMLCLLSSCALVEQPTAELAVARAAIGDAESAGAAERAPAELNAARDRLARAESHSRLRHYDEALAFAQEAEADARLAAIKSRATEAELALRAVKGATGQGHSP